MLPWLDYLVRLPDTAGYDANRVFQCDAMDWRGKQQAHEVQSFALFFQFSLEPSGTADGKMGAWRVGNHHVPAVF